MLSVKDLRTLWPDNEDMKRESKCDQALIKFEIQIIAATMCGRTSFQDSLNEKYSEKEIAKIQKTLEKAGYHVSYSVSSGYPTLSSVLHHFSISW